jgi:6-phosphofructokinase 1
MPNRKGNAIVGQSGGPTAVINQSLVGIIEACRREERIGTVLGMRNGVKGILEERLVDLSRETQETLEAVARTPSSALGSSRTKPTEADCHKILEVLRAHDVRYFFYIGATTRPRLRTSWTAWRRRRATSSRSSTCRRRSTTT